jgi:hypothetical protein
MIRQDMVAGVDVSIVLQPVKVSGNVSLVSVPLIETVN